MGEMGNKEIFKKVVEIITKQLEVNVQIEESTAVVDDLGADSLEVIELIMTMEEEFAIKIEEDEASKLKTVGDIVNAIATKLKQNG